jgi:hypothetical protein
MRYAVALNKKGLHLQRSSQGLDHSWENEMYDFPDDE